MTDYVVSLGKLYVVRETFSKPFFENFFREILDSTALKEKLTQPPPPPTTVSAAVPNRRATASEHRQSLPDRLPAAVPESKVEEHQQDTERLKSQLQRYRYRVLVARWVENE